MKYFQIKIMMPLSVTVTAPNIKEAEAHGRKLTHGKAKIDDLAPYLHSVHELNNKEDWPHGQAPDPAA